MLNHDDVRAPRKTASPLLLGTMGWGTDGDRPVRAAAALDAALVAGVTVLDTADIYGDGDSERAVGAALAGLEARQVNLADSADCLGGVLRDPPAKRGEARQVVVQQQAIEIGAAHPHAATPGARPRLVGIPLDVR